MEKYRYLFEVSYDGTNYSGFQRQNNNPSIQGEIEKALKGMTRNEITIHAAGRTDKGVHALAQVFHADLPFEIQDINYFIKGINKRLPDDIIIKKIKRVKDDFHARHHAKYRVYEYRISKKPSDILTQRFELYVDNFDVEIASEAAKKFIGAKDFTGFSKPVEGKDPNRVIKSIDIKETKKHYIFTFVGESFLRHMVRSIMGTVILVSTKKESLDIIDLVFETKNRRLAGKPAEAKGLFFKKVIY